MGHGPRGQPRGALGTSVRVRARVGPVTTWGSRSKICSVFEQALGDPSCSPLDLSPGAPAEAQLTDEKRYNGDPGDALLASSSSSNGSRTEGVCRIDFTQMNLRPLGRIT